MEALSLLLVPLLPILTEAQGAGRDPCGPVRHLVRRSCSVGGSFSKGGRLDVDGSPAEWDGVGG